MQKYLAINRNNGPHLKSKNILNQINKNTLRSTDSLKKVKTIFLENQKVFFTYNENTCIE